MNARWTDIFIRCTDIPSKTPQWSSHPCSLSHRTLLHPPRVHRTKILSLSITYLGKSLTLFSNLSFLCIGKSYVLNFRFVVHSNDRTSSAYKVPATMSAKECISCLAACERWDAPSLRDTLLEIVANGRQCARIVAARRFGKQQWLKPALVAFCSAPYSHLLAEDFEILDPDDLIKIFKIREERTESAMFSGGGEDVEDMVAKSFNL
jgi:hypothetical protein